MPIKKPDALYYAIIRTWIHDFQVMKVTSEKPHHVYGSMVQAGVGVHFKKHDVKAKFATLGQANDALLTLKTLHNSFEPDRIRIAQMLAKVENDRHKAVSFFIQGLGGSL